MCGFSRATSTSADRLVSCAQRVVVVVQCDCCLWCLTYTPAGVSCRIGSCAVGNECACAAQRVCNDLSIHKVRRLGAVRVVSSTGEWLAVASAAACS